VTVKPCPPRRGNRKGVVEKANHVAAQRFWRTLADDVTVEQAQARLDAWCVNRGDARVRATAEGRFSVAELAAHEVLAPMPAPFPALLTVDRVVSAQALVSFRGNRYSVPPHLHGSAVSVSVRLDGTHLDIATGSSTNAVTLPTVIARHRLAATGAGLMVREHGHVTALNQAAINAATTQRPHRGKERRPPTLAARAEAATLRTRSGTSDDGEPGVVVDLARYAAAAAGRNTLHPAAPETTPVKETLIPSAETSQPDTTMKEITKP